MKLNKNAGKHTSNAPEHTAPRTGGHGAAARGRTGERRAANASGKKAALRIGLIVLAVIVLLAIIIVAIFEIWASAPSVKDEGLSTKTVEAAEKPGDVIQNPATPTPKPTITPTAAPVEETVPTLTPTAAPSGRRPNTYTMLLVGEDVVGMNTDTIMVVMLDIDAHELNLVSIPRDTLVNVTWSIKKANTFYSQYGTPEGLVEGVSELLGYKVDNYAIVNIYAFESIIDAVGGVYFDVPMHMSWGDPTINRHYDIPAGSQWLNGYNALGVVRFRQNTDGTGYPTGDIGRINTQQQFAVALMKQMLKLGNIPNLNKVIDIVQKNVTTDLTGSNVAFFAQEFLKLDSEDITFSTVPYEPVYIRGGSYVAIQLNDWIDMLNEKLNPYYEQITESNLDVLTWVNGGFYSTTGILAGGFDSFFDYSVYQ